MSKPPNPLAESVDVRKLLRHLYFVEEDYRTANLEQATYQLTAARYRIDKMRERMRLEAALELLRAKWAYKYRKKTRNGKPLTEAAVKEKLAINKFVHSAQRELNESIIEEELAKQLLEVFKQRQIAINNIIKANSNSIAKELWELEKNASHEKLRAAAKTIRGKYGKKTESDE